MKVFFNLQGDEQGRSAQAPMVRVGFQGNLAKVCQVNDLAKTNL